MTTAERFRSAVRTAVGKRSVASVATDAGLPRDAIRYVLEGRDPKLSRAAEIAAALNIEFSLGGDADDAIAGAPRWAQLILDEIRKLSFATKHGSTSMTVKTISPEPGSVIEFPTWQPSHVAVEAPGASAGDGNVVHTEAPCGQAFFPASWLAGLGMSPGECHVLSVAGRSMEPTLPHNCLILVDQNRDKLRSGRIFVLETTGGLLVKRAFQLPSGEYELRSDNKRWRDAIKLGNSRVIGEARWMCRVLSGHPAPEHSQREPTRR